MDANSGIGKLYREAVPTAVRMYLRGIGGARTPIDESYFSSKDLATLRELVSRQENFKQNEDAKILAHRAHLMAKNTLLPAGWRRDKNTGEITEFDWEPEPFVKRQIADGEWVDRVDWEKKDEGNRFHALRMALGRFPYQVDQDGNIIVTDRYDFDAKRAGPEGDDLFMGAVGSLKEMDPTVFARALGQRLVPQDGESGYPVRLNLGKMQDWKSEGDNVKNYAAGGEARGLGSIAALGQGDDTALAHMTPGELNVLERGMGGLEYNPTTGLPQFGRLGNFLKGLVRAGASIAGFTFGGPAGAAAASAAATKLTGGSWKQALGAGAMSGLGSWGMQGLSGAGWSPTGAPVTSSFDPTALATASNADMATIAAGGTPTAGLNAAVSQLPATSLDAMVKVGKSAPGLAAMLGGLSQPIGPQAAAQPWQDTGPQFSVKPMRRTPRPFTGDYSTYGQGPMHKWYDEINPAPVFGPAGIPGGIDYSEEGYAKGGRARGIASQTRGVLDRIAGGNVRGPGGGQEDLIDAQLSDGEHVVTAREVSALGDGSNEEGQRRMYQLRKEILKKGGFKNTNPKKQTKPIKGVGHFKITPRAA